MSSLNLSVAVGDYDRNRPLISGAVRIDGVIRFLNFPALAEQDEGRRHKGDPLFPEHRPLEMWLDQKRVMSESSWAAEYQGHPFLVGEIPIEKLKILSYFDRREISATVLSVDKAGTVGLAMCYLDRRAA
jgi:hypothetical protein